jgi:hypothetical protein
MKHILLLGFVASIATVNLSFAANSNDNNCGSLGVTISNLGSNTCTLVNDRLIHGYYTYTSSVPYMIPPGTSAGPIILEQSIFGPELELTYTCGEFKIITISSRQNYCFMSAGNVEGMVKYKQNMSVSFQSFNGSWLWSQRGNINWQIQ